MDHETAGKLRGLVRLARIRDVRDDGETQTLSAEVAEGIWHDGIEVLQPYGFAARVDPDGALALVIAVGGDEGHYVALPVARPSKRMGGLGQDDVALYNAGGDRLALRAGGDVEMRSGASHTTQAPRIVAKAEAHETEAQTVRIAATGGGHLA